METNMISAVPDSRKVGLCCHCGKGLSYNAYHVTCLFCDLSFCTDCHRTHPAAHQPYYKYILNYETPRGARPSTANCTKCKLPSHSRLACNECEFNICVNCVPTSRDLLAKHPHGKWTMRRAPDDLGLGTYSLQCHSCRAGATLSHCGRCQNGIKKGENFWTCVTCIVDYNAQIRFCNSCQGPGTAAHDSTHRFASFLYRVDVVTKDPKYHAVKCLDCNTQVAFSGRELARHPHSRFKLVMGEAERDRRYFQSYRICARKPVRDLATIAAETHDIICGCCNHKTPMNARMFMCPTCTMITCVTCAESGGARSHPHIMFPILMERTIPFALIGQGIARSDKSARQCAKCDTIVSPDNDSFIQCKHCQEHTICLNCTKKSNMPVRHACPEAVEMTFFDPLKQANNTIIAKVLLAQRAKIVAIPQQSPTVSPAYSIKRKSPSIKSVSSVSPISPALQTAQISESAQISSTNQQLLPQLATAQQLSQLYGIGPSQQTALPSIQPEMHQPIYNQEVRRKSIQPALKDVGKAVVDGSTSASKTAYKKASDVVDNIDKDLMKRAGKKMAGVAGAIAGSAARQYIKQETGFTIPRINMKPGRVNQQAQPAHKPSQNTIQDANQLNALHAQLQMKQKILQLQQQIALQQQQQQQQHQIAQNQAVPSAAASLSMVGANVASELPLGGLQTPQVATIQGIVGQPSVQQTPSVAVGASHSMVVANSGFPHPHLENTPSTHQNLPHSIQAISGEVSTSVATPASMTPSVPSLSAHEMAPIPASELQWISGVGTGSSVMAPIPACEMIGASSTHSIDSEMAPIPACGLQSPHSQATNGAEMATVPTSETGAIPPPLSEEQTPANLTSSPASASQQVCDPQNTGANVSNAGESVPQSTVQQTSSQPAQDHHSNYHQPTVEEGSSNEIPETAGSTQTNQQEEHGTSSSNVDGVNQQPGSGHGSQNLHNPPHDQETQQVHPATNTTMHPAQGGNATQQVSSPATPAPSQGHNQTLTPNSTGSPHVSNSLPTTHSPHLGSSHIPTSSNTLPTQSHHLNNSSPIPQVQEHSSAHPSAPVQQGHLPTGPSSSEGESSEYYHNHPLDQAGTPQISPGNHASQQQHHSDPSAQSPLQASSQLHLPQNSIPASSVPSTQAQSHLPNAAPSMPTIPGHSAPLASTTTSQLGTTQSLPPTSGTIPTTSPSHVQNPITAILSGATQATVPTVAPPPQVNINVHGASSTSSAAAIPTVNYVQAQQQQQNIINNQHQQLQALQQRLQMMNLQQQLQSQAGNMNSSNNSNITEQIKLQLLGNQLQGQQGNQNSILGSGLSMIDHLIQRTHNNHALNNPLQQQQQEEIQIENMLNQLSAQSQQNAQTAVLNDQFRGNLELEQLNAQLAALNNMASTSNDTSYINNDVSYADVENYNVNVGVDQSINTMSDTNIGLDMMTSTDVGYDMTASTGVGFDMTTSTDVGYDMTASTGIGYDMTTSTDVGYDTTASTGIGFDMTTSTDVGFGMTDDSSTFFESSYTEVDVDTFDSF